ncbi:MAG: hypothetical protein ACKOPK_22895, partial [Dolichospermum sp.]
TLLDILDGKNKRNVLKNPSQRNKKLIFFPLLSLGVSVSNLTTVVSKTPIVPRKTWIIAVFQIGCFFSDRVVTGSFLDFGAFFPDMELLPKLANQKHIQQGINNYEY